MIRNALCAALVLLIAVIHRDYLKTIISPSSRSGNPKFRISNETSQYLIDNLNSPYYKLGAIYILATPLEDVHDRKIAAMWVELGLQHPIVLIHLIGAFQMEDRYTLIDYTTGGIDSEIISITTKKISDNDESSLFMNTSVVSQLIEYGKKKNIFKMAYYRTMSVNQHWRRAAHQIANIIEHYRNLEYSLYENNCIKFAREVALAAQLELTSSHHLLYTMMDALSTPCLCPPDEVSAAILYHMHVYITRLYPRIMRYFRAYENPREWIVLFLQAPGIIWWPYWFISYIMIDMKKFPFEIQEQCEAVCSMPKGERSQPLKVWEKIGMNLVD